MTLKQAPFDVVEASRRVWLERWEPEAASGMAVFTAILRSYQLLLDQVDDVMRNFGLTFARYQVLQWLATDPDSARTLSWISRTLRIPPATVTNLIDRLEADKLVRRAAPPPRRTCRTRPGRASSGTSRARPRRAGPPSAEPRRPRRA